MFIMSPLIGRTAGLFREHQLYLGANLPVRGEIRAQDWTGTLIKLPTEFCASLANASAFNPAIAGALQRVAAANEAAQTIRRFIMRLSNSKSGIAVPPDA
jgi:hypothetical protein